MRKTNLARAFTSNPVAPGTTASVRQRRNISTAIVALTLLGCTANSDSAQQQETAVSDTVEAAAPASQTNPAAAAMAEYLNAVKTTGSCPNDTTCVYVQTFPGDATREITLVVSPSRKSTSAGDAVSGLSGFSYKSSADADSTVTIDMNYFVSAGTLGNRGAKVGWRAPNAGIVRFASLTAPSPLQADGGAGIAWTEVGKKGADVAIGTIIDKAKEGTGKVGGAAGRLGTIYSIASLLSDVSESLDLSQQHTKWLRELEALEKCAENPTNPLTQGDPGYSARTAAKIRSARSELTEVTGVRYLNKLTEGTASLTPVTSVMSIGLKDGFFWSEQTLGNYSENTIMREARLAVTKCDDSGSDAKGNMIYKYDCTSGSGNNKRHRVITVVGNVTWKWQVGVLYHVDGSYVYSDTETIGSCTAKGTTSGSLTGHGTLMVMRTAAEEQNAGWGYMSRFTGPQFNVQYTSNCRPAYSLSESLHWLPYMTGPRPSGGVIAGEVTGNTCTGGSPATMKWSFAIPAAGK